MTNHEYVLDALKSLGTQRAQELREQAKDMTGTELYEAEEYIPDFDPERQYLNFKAGYICRSGAGRLVKLLQPYDSTIYTEQPENLPAQWGFYWSQDPAKALPFIELATSPYNKGDCCTDDGRTWRSKIDTNTWRPSMFPNYWEEVKD